MIHWLGYAEIRFCENAHLVLARAVEQSGSDAISVLPDAWFVDDRSITLHVEVDTPRGEMVAAKRLLSALLVEAEDGEAVIEVPPFERWSRSAGSTPSVHLGRPSDQVDTSIQDLPDRQTIPMAAARPLDTAHAAEAPAPPERPTALRRPPRDS